MSLDTFIAKICAQEKVSFTDTLAVIHAHYDYHPCEFSNGVGVDHLVNAAGVNEGSCKLFAFATLQGFDQQQTLGLFGNYYWLDVLQNPNGTDHKNIRNFIQYGWAGIAFSGQALTPK